MPELKRTFASGRMNKDLDERLIPTGEYRDASNIQVATSDGSSVGVISNILGNTNLTASSVPAGSTCVGSIAHYKDDKIYYLLSGGVKTIIDPNAAGLSTNPNHSSDIFKDYIIEYDFVSESYKYVVVDIYRVRTSCTDPSHTSSAGWGDHLHVPDLGDTAKNITGIRIGMNVVGTLTNNTGSTFVDFNGTTIANGATYNVNESHGVVVTDIQKDSTGAATPNDWRIYVSKLLPSIAGDDVTFTAPRILNFDSTRYIDAINVIDGMIFWTDNYSEPKKINIKRCTIGTGGTEYLHGGGIAGFASGTPMSVVFTGDNDNFHTRLVTGDEVSGFNIVLDGNTKAHWLEEDEITVIKPRPLTPLLLEMSNTEKVRENTNTGVENSITTTILPGTTGSIWADTTTGVPFEAGTTLNNVSFTNAVDFRAGDILILTNDEDEVEDGVFTSHQVRVRVITGSGSAPNSINATGYVLEIMAVDSGVAATPELWYCRLEQTLPIFETKFPRFSYRYKYEDGEYSTFAPWSEVAFMPGTYDYYPQKGYNLGMVNSLRNLKFTNYYPEDGLRPRDVVEIDILYKESGKPNVYTVKTFNNTDEHPEWPDRISHPRSRGEYELETELIHSVLPSNQLLRPWDNVPRVARSQEISGNRLVFANYIQNYNVKTLKNGKWSDPELEVSLWSDDTDGADLDLTKKSVKTMRTYQVGVVFSDAYGRETPVLASKRQGGLKIEKLHAAKFNRLQVKLKTPPPSWATSYKFYVKETSNEYYNLAMDRWYNAEDGNIWLSFPSSERNKVTEDTFLELKKAHGTDVAVTELARYKILAIEPEAPDFIKINKKSLGIMYNSTAKNYIGNSGGGFPIVDSKLIEVNTSVFNTAFKSGITGATGTGFLGQYIQSGKKITIKVFGPHDRSKAYEIVKVADIGGGSTEITVDGKFGDDMDFTSTNQTFATAIDGLAIEVIAEEVVNKPEFDGRFFCKVYKDLVLQTHIMSRVNEFDFVISDSYACSFIRPLLTHPAGGYTWSRSDLTYAQMNSAGSMGQPATITAGNYSGSVGARVGSGSPALENWAAMSNGASGNYGGYYKAEENMQAYLFWNTENNRDRFFIDQASQYSHDGITVDGAGAFIGTGSPMAVDGLNGVVYGDSGIGTSQLRGTSNSGSVGPASNRGQGVYNNNKTIDISWTGIGPGYVDNTHAITGRSWRRSEVLGGAGVWNKGDRPANLRLDSGSSDGYTASPGDDARAFIGKLAVVGAKFKWAEDPDDIIYTVIGVRMRWGIKNYKTDFSSVSADFLDGNKEQLRRNNNRQRWSLNLDKELGQGPAGYHPLNSPTASVPGLRHDGSNTHQIQICEPFTDEDDNYFVDNPAVFETEPTEDVGLDIYYEAGRDNPVDINADTNEQYVPFGSTFYNNNTSTSHTVKSWSDRTVTFTPAFTVALAANDKIRFKRPDRSNITAYVAGATSATATQLTICGDKDDTAIVNGEPRAPYARAVQLGWSNCYSFGNGIESDRIRDDYNAPRLSNGVKASSTLDEPYAEERRKTGLIYSGLYNSTSGTNNLNQFIQAEKITKDLNPSYGSIQKLYQRDTDLVTFCEDKVLKILANKDALFNADGKPNLTATENVLGQATPFSGDWGISENPESFVSESYRAYFTDRQRGAVLRLSQDGITPISDLGMKDYFADNLKAQIGILSNYQNKAKLIGSWDGKKQEYNLSITKLYDQGRVETKTTLSFSEKTKGWISFKSFDPESGVSLNNEYFTFKNGDLYKHHSNSNHGNFYGVASKPHVTFIINDNPGSIKSFNTLNYEGSQAKITSMTTQSVTDAAGNTFTVGDNEYYNLTNKTGWHATSIKTDKQDGSDIEFKEKEGKWFGMMSGVTSTLSNIDTEEFSVQGLGTALFAHSSPTHGGEGKITVRDYHQSSGGASWD